jgi:DGQHR domain-containing protein
MPNNINNYIILRVVKVRQFQNGLVFTGKIRFDELDQIYKLTERKESILDPISSETINLSQSNQEFQRQLSEQKLRSIQRYLREEIGQIANQKSLGMFPSSVILYNRSYETDDLDEETQASMGDINDFRPSEEQIIRSYRPDLDCCFYREQSDDVYHLYIPRNRAITLIVDGQHRFFGTKQLFESYPPGSLNVDIRSFEFIVTYLVGFDLYEVGQIFATVNFNQKPVNRSLYYDIFGSAPQTDREGNLRNDIRLAHDLALHLNNSLTSPIREMIKLLGKGYGLFSQAFFVEKMIRIFRSGIWDHYLMDYYRQGSEFRDIAQFMKDYLSAIQEAYPTSWPQKVQRGEHMVYSSFAYPFILCKTTGLGAFFRLVRDIFPLMSGDRAHFKENILSYFTQISDEEAATLFSKDGPYGQSGSEGIQDKLYKYLKDRYRL